MALNSEQRSDLIQGTLLEAKRETEADNRIISDWLLTARIDFNGFGFLSEALVHDRLEVSRITAERSVIERIRAKIKEKMALIGPTHMVFSHNNGLEEAYKTVLEFLEVVPKNKSVPDPKSILIRKMKEAKELYHETLKPGYSNPIPERYFRRGQMALIQSIALDLKIAHPDLNISAVDIESFRKDASEL